MHIKTILSGLCRCVSVEFTTNTFFFFKPPLCTYSGGHGALLQTADQSWVKVVGFYYFYYYNTEIFLWQNFGFATFPNEAGLCLTQNTKKNNKNRAFVPWHHIAGAHSVVEIIPVNSATLKLLQKKSRKQKNKTNFTGRLYIKCSEIPSLHLTRPLVRSTGSPSSGGWLEASVGDRMNGHWHVARKAFFSPDTKAVVCCCFEVLKHNAA